MGAADQAFPESIDEILAMVKETPRGRWFLETYEKRLRTSETERILDSIAKLENHIQSLSAGTPDQALLTQAREAIAKAKRDIAALEQKPAELSLEGQLFAKLASLSRQSFNGPPAVSQGVERALRLVSDLDQQLSPVPEGVASPVAASIKPDLFKQDEGIFEPAPAMKAIVTTRRNDGGETLPRGAKLVIQHKPKPGAEAPPPAAEASAQPLPLPALEIPPLPTPEAEAAPAPIFAPAAPAAEATPELHHSRIVIIRRKAEEMEHVPLLDAELEAASASPASAA